MVSGSKHVVLNHGSIGERFTEWTKPQNLVGNGAFKLKSWRFNDHIEVERNPNTGTLKTLVLMVSVSSNR